VVPPDVTANVTVVEWLSVPLVPVMVTVELPTGVLPLVVTVIVDDPDPLTDVGLNVAVAPVGSPLAVKTVLPANPPEGVTVTL
jgi:hypothetical protein